MKQMCIRDRYEVCTTSLFISLKIPSLFIIIFTPSNPDLLLNFVLKLYHKTCEQVYRSFGLYAVSYTHLTSSALSHKRLKSWEYMIATTKLKVSSVSEMMTNSAVFRSPMDTSSELGIDGTANAIIDYVKLKESIAKESKRI